MQPLQPAAGVAERGVGAVGASPASSAVDLDDARVGDADEHVPKGS